jgi:opacity protein-like surface antigen
MFLKHLIKFVFLFFFFVNIINAQKLEFGLGAGISHFKGDISPNFNPLQIGVGANGIFRYNLSRSISLKGQFLYTTYNGKDNNTNDPFFEYRNLSATGNLMEVSATAEYNFLEKASMVKNKDLSPYLFGGIGYAFVTNKSYINQTPTKFSTPVIPYGIGLKYRFKGPFSICAEFGTRYTLSDEFDLNYGDFLGKKNNTAADAQQSKIQYGDLTRKDQYYFTNITLTYTIFSLICPE